MASFKYLIFISLAVLSVYSTVAAAEEVQKPAEEPTAAVEDGARVKKHAYIAAAPGPVLTYSSLPAAYPYAYSAYPSAYSYAYPTAYSAAAYAAYPSYAAYDDGKYWPGKYEKTYYPAYKSVYPAVAYHY